MERSPIAEDGSSSHRGGHSADREELSPRGGGPRTDPNQAELKGENLTEPAIVPVGLDHVATDPERQIVQKSRVVINATSSASSMIRLDFASSGSSIILVERVISILHSHLSKLKVRANHRYHNNVANETAVTAAPDLQPVFFQQVEPDFA